MFERRITLRILRIAFVGFVDEFHANLGEPRLVDIAPGRRPRDIHVGSHAFDQLQQPIQLLSLAWKITGVRERCRDTEQLGRNRLDQVLIQFRKLLPLPAEIDVLEKRAVAFEEGTSRVALLQRFPMLFLPVRVGETYFVHQSVKIVPGGHREPQRSGRRFDLVPVAPVVLRVLDVVVEDEEIDIVNDVEIALPWKIVRLQDGYPSWRDRIHSSAWSRRLGMPAMRVSGAK